MRLKVLKKFGRVESMGEEYPMENVCKSRKDDGRNLIRNEAS